MRSRYRVGDTHFAHFVTCTITRWVPVLNNVRCRDALVASLEYCRQQKGLKIYSWVIMDNHFHAVLAASDLAGVMRDLKRHTAREFIRILAHEGCDYLLAPLREHRAAHRSESNYQVWQEGFHPKEIRDDEMMDQKIDYIECNPLRRGWVVDREHWRYSSAHERLPEVIPVLRCDV